MTPRSTLPAVDAVLLAAIAAVLVAALLLLTDRVGSDEPVAFSSPIVLPVTPTTTTPPAPTTTTPAATTTPAIETAPARDLISDAQLSGVMRRYVNAYSDEDASALTALMTPDVVRTTARGATQSGTDDIAAEHQRQFDAADTLGYRLAAPRVTRVDGAATLATRYEIATAGAPAATGAIALHVVRADDGGVLIDEIALDPDG